MPSRTKTLILSFHPDINPGKLRQITKITKRCTFAVSLFLDEAKAQQLYDSTTLEQCRKAIEARTGLSSGFAQACRDKAKTVLKPYPDRLERWESKLAKLEKEQLKLETRQLKYETKLNNARSTTTNTYRKNQQTLANTHRKMAITKLRIETTVKHPPKFPQLRVRQPIWFDNRIGSFEKAKKSSQFEYWIIVSTLTKGKRLAIPLLLSNFDRNQLENSNWRVKSFSIIWNPKTKRYSVNLRLVKYYRIVDISDIIYGNDMGLKRPVCLSADDLSDIFMLDKTTSQTRFLFKKLKALNNRIARLQRFGEWKTLKKIRGKQKRLSRELRYLIAKEVKEFLPNTPCLIAIGLPKHIRQNKGTRMKHATTYRWTRSKRHRKRLNRWSFKALAEILVSVLSEAGHLAVIVPEAWTSKTCHKCDECNVYIDDRAFTCLNPACGWTGDRDVNAAINIAIIGLGKIAYSLEHKTYYIKSEWRALQYLPLLETTELQNQNQNTGTEIVSSEAVDDVEGRSELSRQNRKPSPDDPKDQKVEQDQVAIPVRVKF